MRAAALGLASDRFNDAAVEAFDKAIGLGVEGSGQAMIDFVVKTDLIEGMTSGGPVVKFVLHVDGEAVGELAAVVGEDGVHRMREVGEEAFEEAGGGTAITVGMDLQVDVAGGAID